MEPADLLRPVLKGWTLPLLLFTLGYTLVYLPHMEHEVRLKAHYQRKLEWQQIECSLSYMQSGSSVDRFSLLLLDLAFVSVCVDVLAEK